MASVVTDGPLSTLSTPTATTLIATVDGKSVDVSPILTHSQYLLEFAQFEDDGTPLQVMVGTPSTIHQNTLDAVEAIKMLPQLTRLLNLFNHPVHPSGGGISLRSMELLHEEITTMKDIWAELVDDNDVYTWLMPLPEYTEVVMCLDDMYTHFCNVKFPDCVYTAITSACRDGNMMIAKWAYLLEGADETMTAALGYACEGGHLDVAKWVVSRGGDDLIIHGVHLAKTCDNGHLDVVYWLYLLNTKHVPCGTAFFHACRRGNLKMAMWMRSIEDYWIKGGFMDACKGGCLEIVQWLVSEAAEAADMDDRLDLVDMKDGFDVACRYGHRDIIEWMIERDVVIHGPKQTD
jgi:hypothetical protein